MLPVRANILVPTILHLLIVYHGIKNGQNIFLQILFPPQTFHYLALRPRMVVSHVTNPLLFIQPFVLFGVLFMIFGPFIDQIVFLQYGFF